MSLGPSNRMLSSSQNMGLAGVHMVHRALGGIKLAAGACVSVVLCIFDCGEKWRRREKGHGDMYLMGARWKSS